MHSGRQSDNGILLGVKSENEEARGIRTVITEVLLYAAVVKTKPSLPTPPASSSPVPSDEELANALDQCEKAVKVCALPLCSDVIDRVANAREGFPVSPTKIRGDEEAYFLPYTQDATTVAQPALQKRQSVSTMFEDATKRRRKTKGRGGESISQAMAGIDPPPSQHRLPETPQPQNDLRRKSLSRASSMTSIAVAELSRPISRSGPLAGGKRSSLHRVESVTSPRDSPTPLDADGSHAQQNKAALSKVIMAAMRLHGLQQKKKPASRSQLPSQVTLHTEMVAAGNEADDEYKNVYHQTFKAALFTFRKYLNAQVIPQEAMRDVVDQLLVMFCTDPMAVDRLDDHGHIQVFDANSGLISSSPFDKPSSQHQSSNVANGWNVPQVKKR